MRRSEALASLSRDHHLALVAAQRLRRADAESSAAARDAFLSYWDEHGRGHFRAEEELLFPAYAAHGDPHHPLVLRALGDHAAIRRDAAAIAGDREPAPELLRAAGARLAAHVRLEERQLFGLIEEALPDADLVALARALERA